MRASRPIEGKPRAGEQPSPRAEAPDPAILPARRAHRRPYRPAVTTASATPTPHEPPTPDSGAIDLTDAIAGAHSLSGQRAVDEPRHRRRPGWPRAALVPLPVARVPGTSSLVADPRSRSMLGVLVGTTAAVDHQPTAQACPGTRELPASASTATATKDQVADYLAAYAQTHDIPAARHARPSADADRGAGSWPRPRTAASPLTRSWSRRARSTSPSSPPSRGPSNPVCRSCTAAGTAPRPSCPRRGRVLVVGAGNSAAADRRGARQRLPRGCRRCRVPPDGHSRNGSPAATCSGVIAPRRGRWFRRAVDDRGRAARAAARDGGAAAGCRPPRRTARRPSPGPRPRARAAPALRGPTRSRSAHRAGARSPGPRSVAAFRRLEVAEGLAAPRQAGQRPALEHRGAQLDEPVHRDGVVAAASGQSSSTCASRP